MAKDGAEKRAESLLQIQREVVTTMSPAPAVYVGDTRFEDMPAAARLALGVDAEGGVNGQIVIRTGNHGQSRLTAIAMEAATGISSAMDISPPATHGEEHAAQLLTEALDRLALDVPK